MGATYVLELCRHPLLAHCQVPTPSKGDRDSGADTGTSKAKANESCSHAGANSAHSCVDGSAPSVMTASGAVQPGVVEHPAEVEPTNEFPS